MQVMILLHIIPGTLCHMQRFFQRFNSQENTVSRKMINGLIKHKFFWLTTYFDSSWSVRPTFDMREWNPVYDFTAYHVRAYPAWSHFRPYLLAQ